MPEYTAHLDQANHDRLMLDTALMAPLTSKNRRRALQEGNALGVVMSCNVGQYLPDNDQPNEEVEWIVHQPKTAYPRTSRRRQGRGNSYVPRNRLEMSVVTDEGQELTLLAYGSEWRGFYIELHRGTQKIRSLHTHQGHLNPGYQGEMSNGHMHFPTEQFPLVDQRSQYAYEVECPDMHELTDIVQYFGELLNIEIDALQLQLEQGGRR